MVQANLHSMENDGLFIAGVFILAGFVKGAVGLGLPTIAIGVLALVLPPAQAAALLVVPSLLTNVAQMAGGGPLLPVTRRLRALVAGIVAGTTAGVLILPTALGPGAVILLGAALVIGAVLNLLRVRLPNPEGWSPWSGLVCGTATGLVTVATGVFVIPAVPYIRALDLSRDQTIQALGLSFTVSSLSLALALLAQGVFEQDLAWGSLLALIPTLVGMGLGIRWRKRLAGDRFRMMFDISLLLLGLAQILVAVSR